MENLNFLEEYKNQNSLLESEKTQILSEASLYQIQKVLNTKNNSVEENIYNSFFKGKSPHLYTLNVSQYLHNILQFNMIKFFEKNNFKIVKDIFIRDGCQIMTAKKNKIESNTGQYFDSYCDAMVFLCNKENKDNMIIKIEKNYYGDGKNYYEILSLDENKDWFAEWVKYSKENNFYKGKKIDAHCNFLSINKNITWNDLIIKNNIVLAIKNNIENLFTNREILKKNNIALKRGLIIEGSAGGGKTMICKIVAKEFFSTVIYVLPSHIKDVSDINRICEMAKDLSPTLLIIEDIDYIAKDREGGSDWSVIELMNKLDGLEDFENVVTLSTTNMIERIEKAIKNRPGRFDRIIKVSNPDEEYREKMFNKFTEKFILDKNINFKKYIKMTDGMSGAYIKDICITAALFAIFEKSLDKNDIAIIKDKYISNAIKEIKDKDFSAYIDNNSSESFGFAGTLPRVGRPAGPSEEIF